LQRPDLNLSGLLSELSLDLPPSFYAEHHLLTKASPPRPTEPNQDILFEPTASTDACKAKEAQNSPSSSLTSELTDPQFAQPPTPALFPSAGMDFAAYQPQSWSDNSFLLSPNATPFYSNASLHLPHPLIGMCQPTMQQKSEIQAIGTPTSGLNLGIWAPEVFAHL